MLTYALPSATTSFVGRTEELTDIRNLLADPSCRLLTLLGAGGIGKTRLALQAAADAPGEFADGVFFVPLNSVASPDLIASAAASIFQLPFRSWDEIVHYLQTKQVLLVLDNFEHLLNGASLLVDLLQGAAGVKLLVTSRERLNLQEEWVIALDGLATPNDDLAKPLESYSAVQLFVQRARQVQAAFSLSENAEAVRTICQRVEGMPLGLELAASWLRVMTCGQIAAQIARSLDFLTTPLRNVPERHRSLRAVFEQSWTLLSDAEKAALMRLSVFRGGFDLQAAESVAGASLALLAGLADKSLIRLNGDGRYDLHELLRQFTAEKLADAGATSATADQHLAYFTTLAEEAEAHVWGRDQQGWYDRLETELDNLRGALSWSLENEEAETGLRLAAALGWLFIERSRPNEGLAWYERLLAANEDAPASLRAKALNRASEIAGLLSDSGRCVILSEQALALARSVNDRWNSAWALSNLGYYPYLHHVPHDSINLLEESIALFRELDDVMGVNHTLRRGAQVLIIQGNYMAARPLVEEALISARESGDETAVAQAHLSLGDICWFHDHNLSQAAQHYQTSIDLFTKLNNRLGMIYSLDNLGEVTQIAGDDRKAGILYREALVLARDFAPDLGTCDFLLAGMARSARIRGQFERAAILIGAVERIFEDYYFTEHPIKAQFRRDVAELRAQLGEKVYDEARATGKAMTRAEIIVYALEDDEMPSESAPIEQGDATQPQATSQTQIDALSEREVEILRLVAAGRSNREIAAELYLALGTVKWYLNTINSKLGVTSRTQAVARGRELGVIA